MRAQGNPVTHEEALYALRDIEESYGSDYTDDLFSDPLKVAAYFRQLSKKK